MRQPLEFINLGADEIDASFVPGPAKCKSRRASDQAAVTRARSFFCLRMRDSEVAAEVKPRRVLIVGETSAGSQLMDFLHKHFPHRYATIGLVGHQPAVSPIAVPSGGAPLLGSLDDLTELVHRYQIDEVLIADFFAPEFKVSEERILAQTAPLVCLNGLAAPQPRHYKALKRGLDIIFSLASLIVAAPLLAILALAIKLTCPGPVLFKQERVGLGGKRFQIYKLRTMYLNAEAATGPVLAQHRDERCWPLGAVLRAAHLDELPQLYNVLRGDMSIVGPRPERPVFVSMYERHVPAYAQRHTVQPGLTGLAQTNGDQLTHVSVKLHYDLVYVYNYSLWLDALMLVRTPLEILRSLGRKETKI